MSQNRLIYGKNSLEKIVSLEVKDNQIEIFLLQPDGTVQSKFAPHKYWILSHNHHRNVAKVLEGNLHYKYMSLFENKEDLFKFKYRNEDKDLYMIYNDKESAMIYNGYTYCKNLNPSQIPILSFDIETNGLRKNRDSRVYLISNTYRNGAQIVKKLFCYEDYNSDGEMIADWCKWVCELNPSFMIGHNIFGYDLPFMEHVASLTGHSMYLGRDGSKLEFARFESKYRLDGTRDLKYHKAYIYGREIIDTMFLAYKYDAVGKKYENYKLKNIIKQEGLEKEGRVYYDAATIKDNIHIASEREKIKQYCIDDSDDALSLYDLMIPPYFYMGQSVPKSIQEMICSASGAQLNSVMVRAYLQDLHSIPKASDVFKYQGAISFGIPGIYRNVWKIDVKSEYPSCILQYNIYDKQKDPKKYFLKMVEYFTLERFKNKKLAKETGNKYYEHMEQSQKVFINSAYGFLGAAGLNFNSPENAALVTEKGRETISKAIEWASGKSADYWIKLGDNDEETE